MPAQHKPEALGPPELFYDETEAHKYTQNSHIIKVQTELSQRAYELLDLPLLDSNCSAHSASPKPADQSSLLLLDIGCGSGLSGQVLTNACHQWIGVDISEHMLRVAREDNESTGELVRADLGTGLPFTVGPLFDGVISVSALQWLCHSNASTENPRRRLHRFFQSLYSCLAHGARAVFQFYPENQDQCKLITDQALLVGFQGGLVVDRPESTRHRKVFLVLTAGTGGQMASLFASGNVDKLNSVASGYPRNNNKDDDDNEKSEEDGMEDESDRICVRSRVVDSTVQNVGRPKGSPWSKRQKQAREVRKGSREWIAAKRERHIRKGRIDAPSQPMVSKYSGRPRRKIRRSKRKKRNKNK